MRNTAFQRILPFGAILAIGLIATGCSNNPFSKSFNPLKATPSGNQNAGQDARNSAQTEKGGIGDLTFNNKNARETPTGDFALARLAERRSHPKQARELYQRLLTRKPNNPELSHRLAVIDAKDGRFKEADAEFKRALELKPDDATILRDLGYSYYLQNRLEEAQEVLEKALKAEPYDKAICNNLALVYGEQRRYDLCLAMFQRTCKDAEAYANLGFVYAQHGELDKAKAMYNHALTLDKGLKPAAEALVQLAKFESRSKDVARIAASEHGRPGGHGTRAGHPVSSRGVATAKPNSRPSVGQASFQTTDSPGEKEPPGEVVIP